MRLIDEQAVHTQLLECYHIVLAALGLQFLQPGFQGFTGALQLLDRETLTAAVLHLGNALGDFVDLLLKEPPPLYFTSAMPSVISSICS